MRGDQPQPRVAFVMEQVLGHATWSLNLRAALARLGADTVWVETTLHRVGGGPERVPGLPGVVRAGLRGLLDVRRGLAGQRYDVLLFNTQKAAMLCQPYLLRTPTLLMTDVTPAQYDRMSGPYEHEAAAPWPVRRAKHAVNALNFRLAHTVVPWSRWAGASLADEYGVSPDRIHVVPPGVDTMLWRPAQRPASSVPRLLFVGGNFARKGGLLLMDAFRELGLAGRAELDIVTRDPVAAQAGVTVHHGLTSGSAELRTLYAAADAFVLPTLADCFSIAAIEAMAAGLPVLTTDVGGISDIVVDGSTGFLIPAGDARALRQSLAALVHDAGLRAQLGAAGRQRAVASFDATTSASKLLTLAAAAHASRSRSAVVSPGA
jgi:glycosyltransferase involved in cell wall biosynthesis